MDFSLNEAEQMLQRTARRFGDRVVRHRARQIDATADFPQDLVQEMAKLGFLGLPYPVAYGGSGAGYLGLALAVEELSRNSMAVGAILSIHTLATEAIYRYGTEEQKERFLVPLARGEALGCFAFTEPATGSNPKALTTRAVYRGADYLLSGYKNFVTLAPVAKTAVVFAIVEGDRISAFIVDTQQPGFRVGPPLETLGLRGTVTAPVYLNGVRVPGDQLLGPEGEGFAVMLEAINVGKLGVSAQAVGVSQAALDLSLGYARRRHAFGAPIAKLPTIQWHLAEMACRVEAARWLTYRTAFLRDRGQSIAKEAALAKLFTSQVAVDVTRMAMQVHGSYGYTKDLEIERLYRDAKVTELYEGVSEIQRVIIATELTGV